MLNESAVMTGFAGLDGLCKAETWAMNIGKVAERPYRLEASFYASDGYLALQAMKNSGFELGTIAEQAVVRWFGPFSRRYVDDPEHGLPFLSSSHMMEARPRNYPLISLKHTQDLQRYIVREGQILVSCSGTIGNVALVTKDLDGWAVSQHAIRVIARDPLDLGPLYCFLQSPLGQFLVKRNTSGSVVPSIYEGDVANLPIPRLPLALRRELTEHILKVSALRVEANRLLGEAEQMLQESLNLPAMETFLSIKDAATDQSSMVFSVRARERIVSRVGYGQARLDATFHDPAAERLRAYLRERGGIRLGELLDEVRNSSLRKRAYVEGAENGVPLMGGKQLTQLRPVPLGFLSRFLTKGLSQEQVSENWILVSCGGTIGRISLVGRHVSRYVFTQDVMRLICDERKAYPGFLFAFLASPYGQIQLMSASYGSVQKKLRPFQIMDLLFWIPSDRGLSVHKVVQAAFRNRAEAMDMENEAFALFLKAIKQGRHATESHWGQ